MLLVVYDIKTEEVITRLKSKAQQYGELNQVLPNAFLLDTSNEVDSLGKELLEIVSNNGRMMIAKISRKEINGWLGTDSVDWINKGTILNSHD